MAGLASIHTNAEMLEDEGPSLIGVAVETRLLIRQALVDVARARGHSPGGGEGAVRIVAVCTGDHSFLDTVFERHRELRAHIGVALFTQRRLGLSE
jgi:hypothetical protein